MISGEGFQSSYISVNGIDFMIYELGPRDTRSYCHKFNGPGIRYKVGIAIATGWIAWFFGLFPDLNFFKFRIKNQLMDGEDVVADDGCKDEKMLVVIGAENEKNIQK